MVSAYEQKAIANLSRWASIAAPLLTCLAQPSYKSAFDEATLCDDAGLPRTQSASIISFLGALTALGLVAERTQLRWAVVGERGRLSRLAELLAAIGFYKDNIHKDSTIATVVLTRPAQPSRLEAALTAQGFATGKLEVTSEAFGDLARMAKRRLVVMTPFLDRHGAAWLSELLRSAPATAKKIVILRYLSFPEHPSYPEGLESLRITLSELGASIHDYSFVRSAGRGIETFHAKVVLADDDYAYVGSANMNRASLEHSMELGVLLRGEAARRVGNVIDAILCLDNGQASQQR